MIANLLRKNYILPLIILTLGINTWAVPEEGSKLMIASPSKYGVIAGKQISKMGGNVVDVAGGVALALSVTSPYYAAFGGGGFALVKMGKKPVDVLDFREMAPAATGPDFYMKREKGASRTGGAAVGVPGVPAGLWQLHKKYGKLAWTRLFDYAINLAAKGFEVSGEWVRNTERASKRYNAGGKKHFMKKGGKLYKPGEVLKQPALAKVLKEMRNRNIVPFYRENVARDIVKTVQKTGGVLTLEDMKSYKPRWLKPIVTEFRGYTVHLMPPPSSGGVVIASALKLMDMLELHKKAPTSSEELHYIGEIQKIAFRGRALLGDPDFHKNPIDKLLDKKYLKEFADKIEDDEVLDLKPLPELIAKESSETTHFTVMDAKGDAVSFTVTLNGNYGSAVVSEKYGIALNNEMDDFTTRPNEPNMFGLIQGKGNLVQPGKRPLSSMSPTIVTKDGKTVLALGAPGGPRIINGVLQVLYRVLVSKYDMDWAIQAPRVHHQFLPKTLFVDKNRLQPDVIENLKKRGHKIKETWVARVNGIRINEKGWLEAGFDSRGEGAAGGY